jgi:hypothetical protein
MKRALIALSLLLLTATCFAEMPSDKWQVATIMQVKARPAVADDASVNQFYVTLKVENTEYVVLYTATDGTDLIRYHVGINRLVLIGSDSIKYNDVMGTTREALIIVRRQLPILTTANKPEPKR